MSHQRILFLAPANAVTRIFPELKEAGFEVGLADNLKGATAFIRKSEPDVIFSRPALPGYRVEALLSMSKAEQYRFPPIIVITDKGNVEEAERLLNLGAKDYWLEPLTAEKVWLVVHPAPAPSPPVPSSTLGGRKADIPIKGPHIVGHNSAIRRVLALAKQVAPSKASVLISGESGTGKEMFARTLHAWSNRSQGPFVAVNCAALPEHLLESELFGHEKGAFTGAIARKLGKFELANGGTILLDEISEMDLALQAKLLRVLQEGEIDRVGGTETVKVDVRILATTNRNLEEWVHEGKFRQDLFFRLNVIPLRLPSLRERGDDILELADFFIDMYVREYHLESTFLSQDAKNWLKQHDWPGNVRELQNLMERAVLLAGGRAITPKHFLMDENSWPLFEEDSNDVVITTNENPEQEENDESSEACDSDVDESDLDFVKLASSSIQASHTDFPGAVIPLHEMERIMILRGLEVTAGNRTQAAELLGISVRTLRNKLNEYRGS